jgi:hypothetical protein
MTLAGSTKAVKKMAPQWHWPVICMVFLNCESAEPETSADTDVFRMDWCRYCNQTSPRKNRRAV